jgi:hypothetical protein
MKISGKIIFTPHTCRTIIILLSAVGVEEEV